jgi:HK97 gp10 family phage protein
MTATIKGGDALNAFLAALPGNLEEKVLRPALKAGMDVIADGARENCRSAEVKASIGTSSRAEPGVVSAKVQTKGSGAYTAPWLEYGTDAHFISVDDEQRGGRTIKRVNKDVKRGSLVIGGQFVGATVHHPGARPYPFMRPALEQREQQAIDAIGGYIAKRLTPEGLAAPAEPEDPE